MTDPRGSLTAEQYDYLMKPLRSTRIAKRSQGGKQLSYLESWDVRAHLTRIFGFGNFDAEMIDSALMFQREYMGSNDKTMWEVAYRCTFRLVIRAESGLEIARYTEGAVGSASGSVDLGGLHDNALKTAASDALKRCAINLGTQFGLSLYDKGSTTEVVRQTLIKPEGYVESKPTPEQEKNLEGSVGVTPTGEGGNEGAAEPAPEAPAEDAPLSTEEAAAALGATEVKTEEHVAPEPEPTKVTEAEMTKRRREMFALFTEAKFPGGNTTEAREQRLDYCKVTLDRDIASSTELTYDDIVKVIGALRALVDSEKASA